MQTRRHHRERLRLLRLGEQGHPGVPAALAELREVFIREVIVDGFRTRSSAEAEFDRMREGERGVGLINGDTAFGQQLLDDSDDASTKPA
jgi:hypothetical protein